MPNVVATFFARASEGDVDGALECVQENVVFEAQGPDTVPIYGTFHGHDGVKRFLATLSEMFDTEAFEFRKWAVADNFVFAYGYMQHRVKKTGRVFKSEWALVCQLVDGRISSYKMFEDTAALAAAYKS